MEKPSPQTSLKDVVEAISHFVSHDYEEATLLAACLALSQKLLPLYQEHFGGDCVSRIKTVADLAAKSCINTGLPPKRFKQLLN